MSSKKLKSILSTVPSATVPKKNGDTESTNRAQDTFSPMKYTRIVASIPENLKEDIREYVKKHKGETETTVILRSLKKMGFNVDSSWIVDKRSTR
ncbi:MAG: hypothetical protein HRU35_08250 [Rickettsiaceae bacterium]|nr:hypothetical protein [Rickettsiaceae bacterium]